jgi:6,7-dimethyl-8-ribityllumazine synthase
MGERSHERPRAEDLDASDLRVAIVVSRYNVDICKRLLRGSLQALAEHGAVDPQVVWVPGALELPLAALTLAESGEIDAIVALGCVIQGDTAHFQFVADQSAAGITHVNLDTGVPCSFGVLTTYDRDQALARSGPKNNKGVEAAETAVEMANLVRRLQDAPDARSDPEDGPARPIRPRAAPPGRTLKVDPG